jgi:hypothetical protein
MTSLANNNNNNDVPNTKRWCCRTTHVSVIVKEGNEALFLAVLNAINSSGNSSSIIVGGNWSRIVIEVADDASHRRSRHDKRERIILLLEKENEPQLFRTILESLEIDADADTNARMVIEIT